MTEFNVGQKVVCVDDGTKNGDVSALRLGAVYTLTEVGTDFSGGICLVAEISPPKPYWYFDLRRFRPVAEKPASMDIIRSIVANPKREIPDDPREPKHVKTPEEVASIPGGLL